MRGVKPDPRRVNDHPLVRKVAARVPVPARRAARRVLGRPAVATDRRRTAFLADLDRHSAPVSRPPIGAPVVTTAVTPRLGAGLGSTWELHTVDASAPSVAPDAALLLLEWHRGGVPGLDAPAVSRLLEDARRRDVPVVVWATDSVGAAYPEGHPVTGADHLFADDPGTAATWTATAGREVTHLGPAVTPSVHRPLLPGGVMGQQEAVAVLSPDTAGLEPLAWLPADHLDVWLPTLPGTPPAAPPAEQPDPPANARWHERLATLRGEATVRRPLDGTRPVLGRYRAVAALRGGTGSVWPVLEAAAAHTPVVLDEATAGLVPEDLRASLTVAADPTELRHDVAARLWQRELAEREGLVAARAVRAGHTFRHRAQEIARRAGAAQGPPDRSVSVIVPTNRPHELDNIIANVARQAENEHGRVQLVLVLHGLDVDQAELHARLEEAGVRHREIVRADPSLTLGACMNLGLDAADGRFVAKVDDDNHYGRHYLTDLLDAFDYSGAGIVGKWAHYIWLRSSGAVLLRNRFAEYRHDRLVQGGAMVLDREVVRELRFGDLPRAVDTDILGRAREAGVPVFSADRFNFVSIRGADPRAHTWPISDTALMNRAGELVFFGDPREHVDV